jgi:MFS family permease
VLGYTPAKAGVVTFVSTLPVLFFSNVGGFLSDRFGPRMPIAIGFLCLMSCCFWLAFHPTPSYVGLIASVIPYGMGVPLVLTPSYSAAMNAVPPKKMGIAFGMVATLRNFSAAMGLALIGLLMATIQSEAAENEAIRQAKIESFARTHLILGFLIILVFASVFILYNRKSSHHLPSSPAEGWD